MDTTTAYAAIAGLDILYVRDDASDMLSAVCNPNMRATQGELTSAVEAIKSLNGVYHVTQTAEGTHVVIKVQFRGQASDLQKSAVYEAFAPKFVHGKAWGNVFRDDSGKHVNTFLRIDVPGRAATNVVAKLAGVNEIAQYSTTDEYKDGRYITGIGFTLQRPTRDAGLNRTKVAEIADELGIVLAVKNFTIQDNLAYASMRECNREDDPIDEPSPAA
mgnify:CR=1 FL=1